MIKKVLFSCLPFVIFFILSCGGDKFRLPEQPEGTDGTGAVSDTTYIQLTPIWEPPAYDFNQPKDVLLGREPLIYIADTGNDRILMLDLSGNILGEQNIENPVALAQDTKLRLLVVSDSNKIFRIDLVAANHNLASAIVDTVFEEVDNPDRKYTGIAGFVRVGQQGQTIFGYYVTATGGDTRDNQVLVFPEDFDVRVPNAVNLEPNGLGILSASEPSGVTTLRDFSIDFIFCMVGQNSFKVQWITGGEFGFTTRISPANGGLDIFDPGKFITPEDVTIDNEGSIYVVDAQRDFLFKFSATGDELQSFGESGSGEKQFNQPHGVAIFNKTLYVADTGNNRIVRFRLSTDIAQ